MEKNHGLVASNCHFLWMSETLEYWRRRILLIGSICSETVKFFISKTSKFLSFCLLFQWFYSLDCDQAGALGYREQLIKWISSPVHFYVIKLRRIKGTKVGARTVLKQYQLQNTLTLPTVGESENAFKFVPKFYSTSTPLRMLHTSTHMCIEKRNWRIKVLSCFLSVGRNQSMLLNMVSGRNKNK